MAITLASNTVFTDQTNGLIFDVNSAERARLNEGTLLLNTTSALNSLSNGEMHFLASDRKQVMIRNTSSTSGRVWTMGMDSDSSFKVLANNSTGVSLSWGGTSWASVSDERAKTNLQPIENALDKLSNIRTVTGRFSKDEETKRRSFFIAQDFDENFPEPVYHQDDGYLGLSYSDTIPLIIAGVKELKQKIDSLKANKLSQAKLDMAFVESEIESLKAN